MKTQVVLLTALLLFNAPVFLSFAEEAEKLSFSKTEKDSTLEYVLTHFKENNPRIKILEGRLEAVKAEEQQAQLWPNPEVSYRVEDAAGTDSFIEASWPLDITGRRGLKRKAANAGIASAGNLFQWEINSLLADVKIRFYELLASQERLRMMEEGARRYESILNSVRGRSGQTDYDRLRLEKEAVEVRADANEMKRAWIKHQSEFSILINENPNSLKLVGNVQSRLAIPSRSALESLILWTHPKIAASLKEAEKRKFERKAARRKWFPELILSGGLKKTSAGDVDKSGFVAGVSVSVPLFDRGQAEYAAAKAEFKISESEAVLAKNEIAQLFGKTYQDALLLNDTVREYETALLNGERLEQMAGLAYLEGRMEILELIDAYRGGTQSRLRLLELALEAREALIELERTIGCSLSEQGGKA